MEIVSACGLGLVHSVYFQLALLDEPIFFKSRVTSDLDAFKPEAELIVANRVTAEIEDVVDKVFYPRSVWNRLRRAEVFFGLFWQR